MSKVGKVVQGMEMHVNRARFSFNLLWTRGETPRLGPIIWVPGIASPSAPTVFQQPQHQFFDLRRGQSLIFFGFSLYSEKF